MKKIISYLFIIFSVVCSFYFVDKVYALDTDNNSHNTAELDTYEAPTTNEGKVTCTEIFGDKGTNGSVLNILSNVYRILKIAVVFIVIVLCMLDFTKATTTSNSDAFKSACNKLVTRLIVLVAFFLVPTLLDTIITLIFGKGVMCSI